MEIGEKLKKLREMHNMSMREVAERTGLHFTYISKIEKGKPASVETLKKLCSLYGVEINFLFGTSSINEEWIKFIQEMEEEGLSPDDVRDHIKAVKTIRGL